MAEKLGIGAPFPTLTLNTVSGETISVPDDLGEGYKVVLFYRGDW